MVDKIIKIKTQHKTLEGIRKAKIIEGKTNKIIFSCVYIKWLILPKKCMKTMA